MFFCGLKSADIVADTICVRVFSLVLRYMQNQYSYRNFIFKRKIEAPKMNIFLTLRNSYIYMVVLLSNIRVPPGADVVL